MGKKFRLTKMEYDEVSLVDAGANQDAHVVLFKRAVPLSKDLLTPADVHSPVPLGEEKPKRPRKGKFNPKQARDHRGKFVAGGYHRAQVFPTFPILKSKTDQSSQQKATAYSSGTWDASRHPRIKAGNHNGGEFTFANQGYETDAQGYYLTKDQFPPSSPGGGRLIKYHNGAAYYSDGYRASASRGFFKVGDKPDITSGAKNPMTARRFFDTYSAGFHRGKMIAKATRKQTKQGDTLSSGPRGENGGSWNDAKHARVPAGSGDASGQFAPSKGDGKSRQMTNPHLSISSAPSFKTSGGGGGKKKKGGSAKKAKSVPAPTSPVSPAYKPMLGSQDEKIAAAVENAKNAHKYADSMKQWAASMQTWAKQNPSTAHAATAARALAASQRAEYAAERADANVVAQKKAAGQKASGSASTSNTLKLPTDTTLAGLTAWMDSMFPALKKNYQKNHRGTWHHV